MTDEQQLHFAEHGWVVLENILDEAQRSDYIRALDRCAIERGGLEVYPHLQRFDPTILFDHIFLDWLKLPEVLEANRQIIGTRIRATEFFGVITEPHVDRVAKRAELVDPELWGWHRGFRPRLALLPHETDERFVNCLYTTNISYLTDVSAGDGSTAVLDGSHRLEGTWQELIEVCPMIQPSVAAGDVLIIAETLIHAGLPIVSERTRYALFYCFVPPWFANWPGYDVPPVLLQTLADEGLRELLGPPNYGGQRPEWAGAPV